MSGRGSLRNQWRSNDETKISKQDAIKYLERKSFPGWDACSDKPTVSLSDVEYLIDLIYSQEAENEPQKPVVPKFVADFYESIKDNFEYNVYDLCLQFADVSIKLSGEVREWFDCRKNEPIQTLVKMKLDGYEIEQEKLYTVELLNPNMLGNEHTVLGKNGFKKIVMVRVYGDNWITAKGYHLTESEIKKDFEWAWQFAKPVEEN